VHQAILAVPSARQALVRRAAAAAEEAGIPLRVLPGMTELVSGTVSVRDVRDLRIEDLLGRQEVSMDLARVREIIAGERVLITGAGGSIGSEIARQVAELEPAALVLLDHDETHLHDAVGKISGIEPVVVLGDVRCPERTAATFARHRPTVVFHAAALKHVPLLEAFPVEAVSTNVVGTRNVARAAREVGTHRLVFVSTDKAVHPTSVMGASKRLGEQLVLTQAPPGARWCAVRFGNVIGSRGSVVPTFLRQIAAGGPVTVTDERMTRFFMSIEEAVQLVLQAATMTRGGSLFMLEMGEPVRIIDLAERMIRLAGRRPGVDIEIRITGPRPGEKLTEELVAPDERREPTEHPHVVRVLPTLPPPDALEAGVAWLESLAAARDNEQVAAVLRGLATGVIDLAAPTGNGNGHRAPGTPSRQTTTRT
jgi:FlaA1/EpsC-like NDP-sugar epimerase